MKPKVTLNKTWQEQFLQKIKNDGPWNKYDLYQIGYNIKKQMLIPEFRGLQALNYLPHLEPFPHQIETAQKVIEDMNGKAILADEVGLGKTIEAGLILKEYMIRGLVKKALILVPASLINQWVSELNQKFHIPAIAYKKMYMIDQYDVIVTSIDSAKKCPLREAILEKEYDVIIVDEAHKLKNNKTKNYEFVQLLKKKYCLLLTATPIQNTVLEAFNLVSILKPGHLGSLEEFKNVFKAKKQKVENDKYLKELINKVMIRNRRDETGIEWTKRNIQNIKIDFSEEERALYESIDSLRFIEPFSTKSAFSILTLLRETCSSKESVFFTLKKMMSKYSENDCIVSPLQEIMEHINRMKVNSKAQKVVELIQEKNEKFIIFTEYRATQLYLQWFLKQNGISSVPFNGKFKRSKRDWMRQLFEGNFQVLIATEAGGEGINLQFCHHVINYDLPWNPMKLEQRIGRVHRLGQKNDVHIYNFSVANTIEERILDLLYSKIGLFEKVIGELDAILAELELVNLDDYIQDIFENSQSEGEINLKIDNLKEVFDLTSEQLDESKASS